MVMRYEEVDSDTREPTGRSASLLGVEFQPLQYSDLAGQKLSDNIVIPLKWSKARVLESNIVGLEVDNLVAGEAVLNSTFASKTIGLVDGGWLPSGLALQGDMIVMPDRCSISELVGRFRNGANEENKSRDFLDLFADKPIRVNPLLYALEGNLKENPTFEVVEQQFEEACQKIKAALPMAALVPEKAGASQGIFGLVQNSQASMASRQDFLLRVAPELRAPVSAKRLPQLWEDVLIIADNCNVSRPSLVVFAVLSSIAVPNGRSPAKRLLKLTEAHYSAGLAYNALADLRSLEVLMCLLGLFPNERLMLLTSDLDLALFWVGIRASNFGWRDGRLHFKLSPVEELLPNLASERMVSDFARGE